MAKSKYLSAFLCILLSLPFIYGFVNPVWTNIIDCMIKKKQGCQQIHPMKIIGLIYTEYNMMLKHKIGQGD